MMKELYKKLDWDTNFFGFPVVELQKDILEDQVDDYLQYLKKANVHLAYYKSSRSIKEDFQNDYYTIQYIVKRFPLLKKNIKSSPLHKKISLYDEEYPDDELIKLGQLAGRQGRFGRDPHISVEQCDEIFKNWVINSVNKTMASHVLVYWENGHIVGFCTIDIRNEIGYCPLFAVERSSEGKGISFALMRAVETILVQNGCTIAAGGTQELNKKALKVYERSGLIPQPPEYVYHFWEK